MLKKDTKIAHRLQNINTTLLKYTGKHHNGKHKSMTETSYLAISSDSSRESLMLIA